MQKEEGRMKKREVRPSGAFSFSLQPSAFGLS
jgi:hypothetical protein